MNYITFVTLTIQILIFKVDVKVYSQERCFRQINVRDCNEHSRYRTWSGRCNNLQHPSWGSIGSTLSRLVPAEYADGRDEPRGGRISGQSGKPFVTQFTPHLPNAREVSQRSHPDNNVPDSRFTHMLMQLGQFIDHDISLTSKNEEIDCCKSLDESDDCFPIAIPDEDRFYSWANASLRCINLIRSSKVCEGTTIREQANEVNSYIDGGSIYGSDWELAALLRTFKDGKLVVNPVTDQLPTREQLSLRPNSLLLRKEHVTDFVAGDIRVNEHPFLTVMHLLFVKEHNKIVDELTRYLPEQFRTDEILYQETRRIVVAELQNIVYGEFLPSVLGVEYMKRYDLIVRRNTTYNPTVVASVINEFATAAFRFGHSMIDGMFKLVSQRPSNRSPNVFWLWRLRDLFDGQGVRGGQLPTDSIMEGLITQMPQKCDEFFTTEITDHLYQHNERQESFGQDLLAINIQRGRDHGLPGYNKYRTNCNLPASTGWQDKPSELSQSYWNQLKRHYSRVDDIDLFLGGVGESNVPGGAVGPTFACIIAQQFSVIKKGDRFFYTHTEENGGGGLGRIAKKEILRRTFSDMLCDVTGLTQIQQWVTLQQNKEFNKIKSCASRSKMDFRAIAKEIANQLILEEERKREEAASNVGDGNSGTSDLFDDLSFTDISANFLAPPPPPGQSPVNTDPPFLRPPQPSRAPISVISFPDSVASIPIISPPLQRQTQQRPRRIRDGVSQSTRFNNQDSFTFPGNTPDPFSSALIAPPVG